MELPKEFTGEGLYVNAKAGIYAIVNPIGEIYIGQSINLEERVRKHKKEAGGRHPLLAKSMVRHGRKNHRYYLVKELGQDVDQAALCEWEKFYIRKFTDDGYKMLNANGGGAGGKKGGFGSRGNKILHQLNYDKFNQQL
jgi:group I intron endonuclease